MSYTKAKFNHGNLTGVFSFQTPKRDVQIPVGSEEDFKRICELLDYCTQLGVEAERERVKENKQ